MSGADPTHDEAQAIIAAQAMMGHRMVQTIQALVQGSTGQIAAGAIMYTVAFLLEKWAEPGREGALLIGGSDYLANASARWPVAKP